MPNFTAGTSFTDGVTNDVTAAKLNALVADAVPTSNLSLNSTTGTIATFNSTTGTIPTLVATTLITTGTGTAAAPAIVPTGDSNTGIFFPAADTIAFSEGGTESMRIDSSGNVGIGISPSQKLDVNGVSAIRGTLFLGDGSSSVIRKLTSSTPLTFANNGGSAEMTIASDGTILFAKNTADINTVGYRFDSNGESFFSHAASTSSGATLYVYSTGAAAYRFYVGLGGTVNATNTAISAISDVRLKENIRDIDAGLNKILELKPRTFDWKDGKGANTKNAHGFIAQEIEQVFPDLVDEWRDPAPEGEEPYKSVRQDLIPVLVKAIQELKSENDSLKSRIEALEAA